tara:strand:+ start:562 stop:1017 length:456 start_codon:yes stop_codon:yes gene_type:complete
MSLKRDEWPAKAIGFMADEVIEMAQEIRKICNTAMVPSPDPEAHVRFTGDASLHCVGADGGLKSQATDLFLLDNSASARVWAAVQSVAGVGGFGMYFDTHLGGEKQVLIHVDTRTERLLWLCPDEPKRRYVYYNNNPVYFLNLLSKELAKL